MSALKIELNSHRTLVMGIVNVTADSFSDGGKFLAIDKAIEQAHKLVSQGADLIDIGGESTRPGASRVSLEQELARVIPVVSALSQEGILTSVDTMRAQVAYECAQAGVNLINDVSGGLADLQMLPVMRDTELPVALMQWRTEKFGNAAGINHQDETIVEEVKQDLSILAEKALAAGILAKNIILDPGLGFAKSHSQDWKILQNLAQFSTLGFPLLIGASRKRFIREMRYQAGLSSEDVASQEPAQADLATAAISTLSAYAGAAIVRVHEVRASREAVEVVARWKRL